MERDLDFDTAFPPVPPAPAPSDAGKTHRRKRAHAEQTREDNSTGSLRDKIRDGRVCKQCGKKDSQLDDVVAEEKLFWARPPRNQVPHGHYCMYCDRVYERRYKFAFPGGCCTHSESNTVN